MSNSHSVLADSVVMDDTSLNTPRPQGSPFQLYSLRENNYNTSKGDMGKSCRTKKFSSCDGLRCEKERLETFINWPLQWLNPEDLARDGFFYQRKADHCVCAFCWGIVGEWEEGDSPHVEHQHHHPECPFIRGEPVGNIPYAMSKIISRITPSPETVPPFSLSKDGQGSGRPMAGSYPESGE